MSGCPSTRWQLALVPQQPGVPRESPSGPPGSPGTGQWTRGRRPARRDGADTAGRTQFGTVRPRTVRWTAAPGRRRRTPRLSKIRRTAEKDRSVSSAIWWSERPASYCSTHEAAQPVQQFRAGPGGRGAPELRQRLELRARRVRHRAMMPPPPGMAVPPAGARTEAAAARAGGWDPAAIARRVLAGGGPDDADDADGPRDPDHGPPAAGPQSVAALAPAGRPGARADRAHPPVLPGGRVGRPRRRAAGGRGLDRGDRAAVREGAGRAG